MPSVRYIYIRKEDKIMIPDVMNVEQLAKYLQLDEQTVYRKARVGQIPAVHIGKTLRFKKDVIDGWLTLSSLRWTSMKREALRGWAEDFAKAKDLKEEDIQMVISRKRRDK